jgi:uncharacterized membrane protein
MLTDAVVAIAMTLLVLPLVEAVPEVDVDDVWSFASHHVSLFVSFAVSFLVILLFWASHRRIFDSVAAMTPGLRLLNAAWLLGIAFLPFPTALIGRGPTTSSTPVYIGTILVLSLLTTAMSIVGAGSARSPEVATAMRRHAVVGIGIVAVLFAATCLACFAPDVALISLVVLAPVRILGDRWAEAG